MLERPTALFHGMLDVLQTDGRFVINALNHVLGGRLGARGIDKGAPVLARTAEGSLLSLALNLANTRRDIYCGSDTNVNV